MGTQLLFNDADASSNHKDGEMCKEVCMNGMNMKVIRIVICTKAKSMRGLTYR